MFNTNSSTTVVLPNPQDKDGGQANKIPTAAAALTAFELEEQLAHVNELNSELEKTNLGILALYKELEEKEAVLVEKNRLLEEQGQERMTSHPMW